MASRHPQTTAFDKLKPAATTHPAERLTAPTTNKLTAPTTNKMTAPAPRIFRLGILKTLLIMKAIPPAKMASIPNVIPRKIIKNSVLIIGPKQANVVIVFPSAIEMWKKPCAGRHRRSSHT